MSALLFDRVDKFFAHHAGQKLLRERVVEMLRPSARERFQALKGVSFQLAPGESLGLIGHNGAGKSTILNLATGLALPDAGRIEVKGRIASLLELGAGFHPDLTGAENLRINAALSGLTRRQTAERFEEIVEFSGVRDFIHEPLRTYSSGMMVRLAFSVAIHTDPEILLVDEVIGAGDQDFYVKCLDKIRGLQRDGKTMLLASHSLSLVGMLCQRALWLDHGRVVRIGPATEVVAAYESGLAGL
jgi:ABC-type polysaccharide/polyol phosphate transport system ATPase subunit